MHKPAPVDQPVHDLIRERWSPRAFADRAVPRDAIASLLEAARWAPSCFNEQPWSYLIATREQPDELARMAGCLVDANRVWAARAPVLMIAVARGRFARNDKPNPHAWHDVGLASAQLTLQATSMGLAVHQMAGIERDKIRETYALPGGHDAVAGLAIGYPGDPADLDDKLRERELAPRERRAVSEFAFTGSWGQAVEL